MSSDEHLQYASDNVDVLRLVHNMTLEPVQRHECRGDAGVDSSSTQVLPLLAFNQSDFPKIGHQELNLTSEKIPSSSMFSMLTMLALPALYCVLCFTT